MSQFFGNNNGGGGGGDLVTLTGTSGGPISPIGGNIFLAAGEGVTSIVGTAGTLTFNVEGGGIVDTIVAGSNISVDDTDPANPVVSVIEDPTFTGLVTIETTTNGSSPVVLALENLSPNFFSGVSLSFTGWNTNASATETRTIQFDGNNWKIDTAPLGGEFLINSSTNVTNFSVSDGGLVTTLNNTLDDGSGDLTTTGNVTVGSLAGPGQSIFLPTDNFSTYNPTITSSNTGISGYSILTIDSDSVTYNLDSTEDGQFQILNSGSHAAFGVQAQNGGGFGIDAVSANASYYMMDLFVYGSEELGFPFYFSVYNVTGTPGTVTTLNNTLDDSTGNANFIGETTINQIVLTNGQGTSGQFLTSQGEGMPNIWTSGGEGGGIVDSVVAGANISVDDTDPVNPVVSVINSPTFTGNLTVYGSDNVFNLNKTAASTAFTVWNNSTVNDLALRIDTSANNNLSVGQDLTVDGIPPDYVTYFHVIGNAANGTLGLTTTLFNTLDDGSGNLLTSGNVTIGQAGTGATLFMPISDFDTYSPNAVTSVFDGGFSLWTFSADGFTFNMDNVSEVSFTIQSPSSTSPWTVDYLGNQSIPGYLNVTGNITSNNGESSEIILGNDGLGNAQISYQNSNALGLQSIYYEPFANTTLFSTPISIVSGSIPTAFGSNVVGVQIYSVVDGETGLSVPYYQDEGGNNFAWGTGGGSGSVTEVGTTNYLTVDGTPGASITTSGTLSINPAYLYYDPVNGNGFFGGAGNTTLTGVDNTCGGNDSGDGLTTGSYNTFYGHNSGTAGTTLQHCVGIGNQCLASANANYITAIGSVCALNVTAQGGCFMGYQTFSTSTSSSDTFNTAIGYQSLQFVTGSGNTSLGSNTGNGLSGACTNGLFLGFLSTASDTGLTNCGAIGYNSVVSASNSFVYGNDSVYHGFGTSLPASKIHAVSGATSGSLGFLGVLRLNGINDADNDWPVTDQVTVQNAVITDGVETVNILVLPLPDAYNGSVLNATITICGITGNGVNASSGVTGTLTLNGMWDAVHDTYWINGSSSATPVPIVLNLTSSDTTMLSASAQAVLTGTSGPMTQNLLITVTGINANFVNWNATATYITLNSVSNT